MHRRLPVRSCSRPFSIDLTLGDLYQYVGDVTIVPPLTLEGYSQIISNPTLESFQRFVNVAERRTWPNMEHIRSQYVPRTHTFFLPVSLSHTHHTHIHTHKYAHTHTHTYPVSDLKHICSSYVFVFGVCVCVCVVWVGGYGRVGLHVCVCSCACVYVCVCMQLCVCVCVHVFVCACVCQCCTSIQVWGGYSQ